MRSIRTSSGWFQRLLRKIKLILYLDRTPGECADLVERFLNDTGGEWDWDDLVSIPIADAELHRFVRDNLVGVEVRFPPTKKGHLTNDEGEKWLWQMVEKLREMERVRLERANRSGPITKPNP